MFGAASAGKTLYRCRARVPTISASTASVLLVCYAGTMRPPLAPLYCRGALSVTPPAVEGGSAEVAAQRAAKTGSLDRRQRAAIMCLINLDGILQFTMQQPFYKTTDFDF